MLIDKLSGNEDLLKRLSIFMYYMNKEVAKDGFVDFLDFCDLTLDEWKLFKS